MFGTTQQAPSPKQRRNRVNKRVEHVNSVFASLEKAHKKASVYFALGRAAGLNEDVLRRHAAVSIALIEGAS